MHLALKTVFLILAIGLAANTLAAGEEGMDPVGPWFGGDHEKCAACHNPGAGGDRSRPTSRTCLGCHESIGRSVSFGISYASSQTEFVSGHVMPQEMYSPRLPQGGKTVIEELDCLTCHNPHGEEGRSTVLRDRQGPQILSATARADKVSRFCVGCHQDMSRFGGMARAYSRHPIGLTAEIVRDPYLPVLPLADIEGTEDLSDDVVACTTCHYVHNGPNKYLLRWDRSIERQVCGQCHIQGRPRDGITDPGRLARLG